MSRCYNFSAGPAVLPLEVLEEVQRELLDYKGSGTSILECSHRGKAYSAVHEEAISNIRELLELSDDFAVLFLQGGASMQFAMVPLNLLGAGQTADYVNSGAWAAKALKEAGKVGSVNVAADCAEELPARMPAPDEPALTADAAYLHLTSNETISGTQWKTFPDADSPLVADMSSDILSRRFDAGRFGLIYAGAQKNLGPAGVTLVVIRKELAERAPETLPTMLRYRTHIEKGSRFNTPPCFSVYVVMLVTRWIKAFGPDALYRQNVEKAARLYAAIDGSDFYKGTAVPECRSDMNVTFRLPGEELEATFVEEAEKEGLKGLKGHRSVGGLRASIYNAFPPEGIDALVSFMQEFEKRRG
jgi:phosphoserine aminotransferase